MEESALCVCLLFTSLCSSPPDGVCVCVYLCVCGRDWWHVSLHLEGQRYTNMGSEYVVCVCVCVCVTVCECLHMCLCVHLSICVYRCVCVCVRVCLSVCV